MSLRGALNALFGFDDPGSMEANDASPATVSTQSGPDNESNMY